MAVWKKVVTESSSGNISQTAATVTTNANLTGDITSSGNATSIAAGVIVNADISSSASIGYAKLDLEDNIDGADIQTDAISVHHLNTTGTASSSTYLRGDMAWTAMADTDTTNSSLAFNTTSGVLTLTDSAGTAKTVDLDGKYAEKAGSSSQSFDANNLTVAGNLTVTGTTTTVNTATLTIEDENIVMGIPASGGSYLTDDAAQTAVNGGGIALYTDAGGTESDFAKIHWSKTGDLTGWQAEDTHDGKVPIAVMHFDTSAASGNGAGVGAFHYDTSAENLYIRTS